MLAVTIGLVTPGPSDMFEQVHKVPCSITMLLESEVNTFIMASVREKIPTTDYDENQEKIQEEFIGSIESKAQDASCIAEAIDNFIVNQIFHQKIVNDLVLMGVLLIAQILGSPLFPTTNSFGFEKR